MENNYKAKLKNLINNSKLSQSEKDLWELFMIMSTPEEDEAVFEALVEDKNSMQLFTKYLCDKIKDMKERNKKAWNNIISLEAKYADLLS